MDDFDGMMISVRPPTAARPLLGCTLLLVEDSRYASEAMRLLSLRSGARAFAGPTRWPPPSGT